MPALIVELAGPGPLHARLTEALRRAILEARTGSKLPSTRALARSLGLSRNTVLAAYEQLRAEGYLEAREGSGSYARPLEPEPARPAPEGRPARLAPFAARALAQRAHESRAGARPPSPLDLAYGAPLVTDAMRAAWRRALGRASRVDPSGHPPPEGLVSLRRQLAAYLFRRRGLEVDPDDLLVVSGAQQGFDLCARALLGPGGTAVLENPHYQGARHALIAQGARVRTAPVDGEGLVVDRLPRRGARLVCVTPSHQFPTGALLSPSRRLALLAWADRHDAWVIEDDYDGEFRYDARPVATLRSLDKKGRVIYLGTFSNLLFPSLRLGYIAAPPPLREALRACKWLADRGSAALEQRALADLIGSGHFERLLRAGGKLLFERRSALLSGLEQHCGGLLEVLGSSAGSHLAAWLTRHGAHQVDAVLRASARRGLGVYSMAPYYMRGPSRGGLLLGYAGLDAPHLVEAARRLGEALNEVVPACLKKPERRERLQKVGRQGGLDAHGREGHGVRERQRGGVKREAVKAEGLAVVAV